MRIANTEWLLLVDPRAEHAEATSGERGPAVGGRRARAGRHEAAHGRAKRRHGRVHAYHERAVRSCNMCVFVRSCVCVGVCHVCNV